MIGFNGMENRASGPIFLFGLQRSGTTQAWNLLQSQPETLWPCGELHQVLRPGRGMFRHQKRPLYNALVYLRVLSTSGDILNIHKSPPEGQLMKHAQWFRRGLVQAVSENTRERDQFRDKLAERTRGPDRILVKVMNRSISFAPDIAQIYPDATFIVVLRDLVAVCEGHLARGQDIDAVTNLCNEFTRYCENLMGLDVPIHAFLLETFLENPPETALALLRATGFNQCGDDEVIMQDRVRTYDQPDGGFRSENIHRRIRLNDLSQHARQDVNIASRARLGETLTQELTAGLIDAIARQHRFAARHALE